MSEYQRKPTPKLKKHRQCTWVDDSTGERCNKEAVGYFFCAHHFLMATLMESCAYNPSTSRINLRS